MSPKLDFMLKKFDGIDQFKTKLETPVNLLMDNGTRDNILRKVPIGIQIERRSASSLLRGDINFIVYQQTLSIRLKYVEICAKIDFQLHNANSYNELNASFVNWSLNPTVRKHMKNVYSYIPIMKSEYICCREKFTNMMRKLLEVQKGVEAVIDTAKALVNRCLESIHSKQIIKIIGELACIMAEIKTKHSNLNDKLNAMEGTLEEYNLKRIAWAELLIGMRKTLTGERKLVKLTRNSKQIFTL